MKRGGQEQRQQMSGRGYTGIDSSLCTIKPALYRKYRIRFFAVEPTVSKPKPCVCYHTKHRNYKSGDNIAFSVSGENNAINSIAAPDRHIAAPTHKFAVRSNLFLYAVSISFFLFTIRNTIHDTIIAPSSAVRRIKSANCVDERPKKVPSPHYRSGELINTEARSVRSLILIS